MKKVFVLFALLTSIFAVQNALAFDVSVSNETASPGDTVTVSVDISNHTNGVVSIGTTLTWDPNFLQASQAVNGSALTGFNNPIANFNNPGEVIIAQDTPNFPGPDIQAGQTLTLQFTVLAGAPSGNYPITLVDMVIGDNSFTDVHPTNIQHGSINVPGSNQAPTANDDNANTNEDNAVVIDVLANDTDPDVGDTLNVDSVTQATNGTVANNGSNVTYTPDPNFNGVDSFSYTVTDGNGGFDTANVTVNVAAVNDDPVATNDITNTPEDNIVVIDVLANDSDPDIGDVLEVDSVTQPAGGQGTVTHSNTNVTFTPFPNFNGPVNFTYTVRDNNGGFDTANVTVNVTSVNDNPDAIDDSANTNEDTAVNIDVLANDFDIDQDNLQISNVTQGISGSVTNNGSDVTYTPNLNFNGVDSFTYTVSDGNGGFDTANVTVNVAAVNDNPVAYDDNASTNENTLVIIDVLANDTDVDQDTLQVSNVTQGSNGTVVNNVNNVSYTPNTGFSGQDTFQYTANDGNGGSDVATVTVTVNQAANNPPVANDDVSTTDEDVAVNIDVLANDTDLDQDNLQVSDVTQSPNGSVINNGSDVTFTPNPHFFGQTQFSYTVTDGNGGFDTANVSVTVNPVNDAPFAEDDVATTDEDLAVIVDVLANDSDIEQDPLHVSDVTQGTNGTVVNNTTSVTYTPNVGFTGQDTFQYTANDGNGGTDTATVTITVNAVGGGEPAQITQPLPGITLTNATQLFMWTQGVNVTEYYLDVATASSLLDTMGQGDIYSASTGTNRSQSVTNIPLDGNPVFAAVWSFINGQWVRSNIAEYQTQGSTGNEPAQITSPTNGTLIDTFVIGLHWSAGVGVDAYQVEVGTKLEYVENMGQGDILSANTGLRKFIRVEDIPLDGTEIYAAVWSLIEGQWIKGDTFTYPTAEPAPAQITRPVDGELIVDSTIGIFWNAGVAVTEYRLEVGTQIEQVEDLNIGGDIFSDSLGTKKFARVKNVPLNGSRIYAAVWSKIGDNWFKSDTLTYLTQANVTPAQITSPENRTAIVEETVGFFWTTGVNVEAYRLEVGSTPEQVNNLDIGGDIFSRGFINTFHFARVKNIPLTGQPIYAAIWSKIGGQWFKSRTLNYYTALRAQIVEPAPSSQLTESTVEFVLSQGINVRGYSLEVATSTELLRQGKGDIYSKAFPQDQTSVVVDNIPLTGETVYAIVWTWIYGDWYPSTPVRYRTADGSFTLNLEMFPYFQTIDPPARYSGAAALKMSLTYLWWNKYTYPNGPNEWVDIAVNNQDQMFDHAHEENYAVNSGLDRLDARAVWKVMNELSPPYDPFHYNYSVISRTNVEDALNDIAKWVAYEAGGGSENSNGYGVDGHPVHAPAIVPVSGDYSRWTVVRGIRTTDNPWNVDEYGIYGFWINDPTPFGLGENTFVTAKHWTDVYYLAMSGIQPLDPNYNKWVSVVEPPADDNGVAHIIESKAQLRNEVETFFELDTISLERGEQPVYIREQSEEDSFDLIAAAVRGVQEELIPYDDNFAQTFEGLVAAQPIYVTSQRGDYYVVPFEKPLVQNFGLQQQGRMQMVQNGRAVIREHDADTGDFAEVDQAVVVDEDRTKVVVVIDAVTGALREAAWTQTPVKYLPVDGKDAIKLVARYLLVQDENYNTGLLSGATVELVYRNGSTFYPEWKVMIQGRTYYIDQNQNVTSNNE